MHYNTIITSPLASLVITSYLLAAVHSPASKRLDVTPLAVVVQLFFVVEQLHSTPYHSHMLMGQGPGNIERRGGSLACSI